LTNCGFCGSLFNAFVQYVKVYWCYELIDTKYISLSYILIDIMCLHCFRSPKNPQQKIIKRVIALEGDFIKTLGYKNRYLRVPDGHFWIEGDHHGHSLDSNSFGPVSLGLVHGRASHIIWPPNRWQRIEPSLPPERKPLLNWHGDTTEEED
uniref:Mitochondrial inner membrane protease subunit 2 n=1 Tax=Hucho hucho TaxID=62062 RepID=A0A4W5R1H9_9TELE